MSTTDEILEKLLKENEQLKEEIKKIDEQKKPLEKQLNLNKGVLGLIARQKSGSKPKKKYPKKEKQPSE